MTMIAAEWVAASPAVVAALAVLLIPGLIATAPLRLPLFARLAVSGAGSVFFIGCAGILAGIARIPFAGWQPLMLGVIGGALAWAFRFNLVVPSVRRQPSRWGWLALSWVLASTVIVFVAFRYVPSPDGISQTYDNVFHLSAIAHILETGDASSLTLRTLIETDRSWSFYPSGWHSFVALTVQLSGAAIPVAVNACWIAACCALWLPGVTWLSQVMLRNAEPGAVALVALPLATGFAAMPYGLLTWGTLYPTFLAMALLPVALGTVLWVWQPRGVGTSRRGPAILAALAAAVALGAIVCSQPRVLVSWGILVTPFAVGITVRAYKAASSRGGLSKTRARVWLWCAVALLVISAAAAFAYLVFRLGLFERPLDDRLSGPQAKASQSIAAGFWQVLSQSWPLGVDAAVTFPAVVVAVLVLVGLVVAARTKTMRWAVIAYALVATLFALAAGSDDVFSKLATALWYKDRYRLASAIPVIGVPLGALGAFWIGARVRRGWSRFRSVRPPSAVPLAITLSWVASLSAVISLVPASESSAHVFRLPERAASSEILSRAQKDFMSRIASIVPVGQRVLGDPWDGSALTQLYGERAPVFPHVNGQWDADRLVLAWRLTGIADDPAVCAALDALKVRYVLYNPHEFGGGDPAGNHFAAVHQAVEAGLFTPVATDGDSSLFRIDQCGPLPDDSGAAR